MDTAILDERPAEIGPHEAITTGDVPAPLSTSCPRCTDGIATTNDPSSARRCPDCDGTGTLELCCDLCGDYGASEFVGGRPFHLECAEEVKADAFWVEEYVL